MGWFQYGDRTPGNDEEGQVKESSLPRGRLAVSPYPGPEGLHIKIHTQSEWYLDRERHGRTKLLRTELAASLFRVGSVDGWSIAGLDAWISGGRRVRRRGEEG